MKFSSIFIFPFKFCRSLFKMVVVYLPGNIGNRLRYIYYKNKFKRCGNNVIIDQGVIIDGEDLISIGDNVHIDKYCVISTGVNLTGKIYRKENNAFKGFEGELIIGNNVHLVQFCIVMAFGGVEIGNYCTLSAGTKIYSLSNLPYDFDDRKNILPIMPYKTAPFILAPVVLDENVWIGLNCIVMAGVHVNRNSFAVSNSLLMGEFPENSYISGQPAINIKKRYDY